ncbi:unnamed protein product [Choristocarpus tenellus]
MGKHDRQEVHSFVRNIVDGLKQRMVGDKFREARSLTAALMMVWILRFAAVDQRKIASSSMQPTLQVGDHVLIDKVSIMWGKLPGHCQSSTLRRNDIVVFKPPESCRPVYDSLVKASTLDGVTKGVEQKNSGHPKKDKLMLDLSLDFTKRVVAVEGDCVRVRSGHLEVNEGVEGRRSVWAKLEIGVHHGTGPQASYEWGPIVVPKGSVLVLGDNRDLSFDSHLWGPLPMQNVMGRVVMCFWPIDRISWFVR